MQILQGFKDDADSEPLQTKKESNEEVPLSVPDDSILEFCNSHYDLIVAARNEVETKGSTAKRDPDVKVKVQNTVQNQPKKHRCGQCPYQTNHKGSFIKHLRTHSGERPFKCKECTSAFKEKRALTDHLRIHSGERPFKCNTCSRAFKQKNHLKLHEQVHSGERPFQCTVCKAQYKRRADLKKHMRKKHEMKDRE